MHIMEVKENAAGEITDVMINGNTYSMEQAVKLAKSGELKDVTMSTRENGEQYISHTANGMDLSELPRFN